MADDRLGAAADGGAAAEGVLAGHDGELAGLVAGEVEGGEAEGAADGVAGVRVEEERHALRAEVAVAVLGACRRRVGEMGIILLFVSDF